MFAQQLVNGLMLGGAYALVAIGYTLIFGVLNLLHLAHGEVFMVGAYVGLVLALAGFPPWATLGGAMLAAAALGVVVDRVAFRPVRSRGSHVTPVMTTIAVGLVLQHVVVKIFGAEPVAVPAPFASASLALGPVTLSTLQLLILGTSLALLTLLEFFFSSRRRHTRLQGDWSSDVCSSDLRLDRPFALGCNQISDRSQERKDDRGGRRVRGNLLHDGPDSGRDEGNREQGGRDGRKAQTNRSRTTPAPRLEQQQTGGQRLDPDEGAQRDEGERGHR